MEDRREVVSYLDSQISYLGGKSLSEAIEILQKEQSRLSAGWDTITVIDDYDGGCYLEGTRKETDEEMNARLSREKIVKDAQAKIERETYERLKKKFGETE